MTFGAATLLTPVRRKAAPRGKAPPRYDCGNFGLLTMAEMLRKSGVTKQTMRYRLTQGWTDAHLLSKAHTRVTRSPMRPALTVAAKIAAHYPDCVPTVGELMALHPMTRKAAWCWRNAWRMALEAA